MKEERKKKREARYENESIIIGGTHKMKKQENSRNYIDCINRHNFILL